MPRLVRRKPWADRVKAMLNPMDFLLWLSEEIETRDWDSKLVGTQLGLVMNFAFLLARANSGRSHARDPVFEDGGSSGFLTFFIGLLVWFLIGSSLANASYTITRSRKYRLFEANVERGPETPSARRVRVQSSPASSSPLRIVADLMSPESAESRAHPDKTRDVWELAVWDPLPICLQIFCLFSPGHVLAYILFLPLTPRDPRPSVTVFNCLVLQVILSVQMMLLQSRFSQQNKDTSILQKEVMHEYETKFVHPRLYPTVRDAATQLSEHDAAVEVGTPTVQLRRGFQTRPNPNYVKHIDPEGLSTPQASNAQSRALFTPHASTRQSSDIFGSSLKSRPVAVRRSTPGLPTPMNPNPARTTTTTSMNTGNGGYLGVYNHPNSPIKKAQSLGELQFRSPRNNKEMAQLEQYEAYRQREGSTSPVKSTRRSNGTTTTSLNQQVWDRPQQPHSYERYPSMWGR
ncbi:hypothetical protein DL765_000069 [Monosporascus sp. GIB2]|nr:hypothetical protein DL765_000069 [Monosporascus sp. GIB2]